MEGENKKRKTRIQLDWDELLPRQKDEEPPPLLVVTNTAAAAEQLESTMSSELRDDIQSWSDSKLDESIERQRKNYETLASKLPDKGEKIQATLRRYEEEKERRKSRGLEKQDDAGGEKPTQSHNPNFIGSSCGFRQGAPSSLRQSQFGSHFYRKMEENTDCRTVNAFEKEFTSLGRCDRRSMTLNGQFSARGKSKSGLTSRQISFQCPSTLSFETDKHNVSNGIVNDRPSPDSHPNTKEDLSGSFSKRNASKVYPSMNLRSRKEHTVVLLDEEEPQIVKTIQQGEKVDDRLKKCKIYYPSRDDPESVEICYTDMECLAPETYLSSTIMNFYIRYLQQPTSATYRATYNYHFFNTYFYKKLKEAVLNKTSDKENLFVKFRRWWKGVNIFEKAYILLPVHENLHWSLVIICIPDRENESGLIILHLDSLGLHCSRLIFDNIKSFLRKEWNYLKEEVGYSDYPIAERIWNNLPRRIEERTIMVPQQKNEYDCGLFVLFFMERFIEEAPQRLKEKDLAMFSERWFNPEEASNLRLKIRTLLLREFKKEIVDRRVSEL